MENLRAVCQASADWPKVHKQAFSVPSRKPVPPASVKKAGQTKLMGFEMCCVLQVLPLPFGKLDVLYSEEGLPLAPAAL